MLTSSSTEMSFKPLKSSEREDEYFMRLIPFKPFGHTGYNGLCTWCPTMPSLWSSLDFGLCAPPAGIGVVTLVNQTSARPMG